jgi:hypothetical protein
LDWNSEWIQPILDQIIHRKLFFSSESKEFLFPTKGEQETEALKVILPLLNFGDSILLEESERITGFQGSSIQALNTPTVKSNLYQRLSAICQCNECSFHFEPMVLHNKERYLMQVKSSWNPFGSKVIFAMYGNEVHGTYTTGNLRGTSKERSYHFNLSKSTGSEQTITNEIRCGDGTNLFPFPVYFGSSGPYIPHMT